MMITNEPLQLEISNLLWQYTLNYITNFVEKMEAYLEVMEINQEKMEAVTEHYKDLPCAETMHVLTTLQYWTCNVLHEDPTGGMYETTGATEGLFGGPASGHRVPQSTENMDPRLW